MQAPAEVVAEHIGPTIGVVTPLDDSSCQLVSGSNSLDEMALWIGLVGAEMTVHEPVELRRHMAALGARLVRAAQPIDPAGWGPANPKPDSPAVKPRRGAAPA